MIHVGFQNDDILFTIVLRDIIKTCERLKIIIFIECEGSHWRLLMMMC